MALLMKIEYPDQWPTFFRDLLNLLNGASPPVVDLFLRIIKAVDEEVVSHELFRYIPGPLLSSLSSAVHFLILFSSYSSFFLFFSFFFFFYIVFVLCSCFLEEH